MFKKHCKKCSEKIDRKFEFCPYCGNPVYKKQNKENYGLLGIDDQENLEPSSGFDLGLGAGVMDKMLASAMKMLEKEMRGLQKQENNNMNTRKTNIPKTNFQLHLNGKKINLGNLEQPTNTSQRRTPQKTQEKLPMPSEETIMKAIKLPRKEAETKLKRLGNKVVYEVEAPGTRAMDKILINKIEGGIEIRIFTKDKVLTKNITIKLPLIAYYLKKQKLFLEFQNK